MILINISGSSSSALLELLNPEENHNFVDQFLNISLDFSETIFVCTANSTVDILEPLLDRIEVIKIDDYTFKEKREISEQFIIPNVCKEFGFLQQGKEHHETYKSENNQTITIPEDTIVTLVKEYSPMSSGMRGIRRTIEKLIRKINMEMLVDKQIENYQVDVSSLKKFLSDRVSFDANFKKMMRTYNDPGSLIVADQSGYISKMIMKPKDIPQSPIDTTLTSNILRSVEVLGKLDKPVEEAFKVALHLARDKLADLYNNDLINDRYSSIFNDYNIWISTPSHKKRGNAYGLAFYIAMLSSALRVKLPTAGLLVIGELSPHGNVLKVYDLSTTLTQCEFHDINTIILPEGNRDEYNQIVVRNDTHYKVYFVKHASQAFELLFSDMLKSLQKTATLPTEDTETRGYRHLI